MTRRRKIFAGWFFVVAASAAIYFDGMLYVNQNYPTSPQRVRSDLPRLEKSGSFRVAEARGSGYSEQEIVDHPAIANASRSSEAFGQTTTIPIGLLVASTFVAAGVFVLSPKPRSARCITSSSTRSPMASPRWSSSNAGPRRRVPFTSNVRPQIHTSAPRTFGTAHR